MASWGCPARVPKRGPKMDPGMASFPYISALDPGQGVQIWVQNDPKRGPKWVQTHHVLAHFGSHSGTPFGQGPSRIKWDFGPFGSYLDPKRGPKYDPKWVDSGVPGQPQAPGGPSQNPNVSREF